jgi:hypothetical protein
MASTYSPSLKLELIGNGDQSGTWGTTTNTNLGTLLEQAITGVQAITMANADKTLTNLNGLADEARNAVLVIGGTNSAIRNIIAPAVNKQYVIVNNTIGGYAIVIKTSSSTGVSIANGTTQIVYCDGTEFYTILVSFVSSSSDVPNTVVMRDGSGNFASGVITASLTGNVTGNLTGNVTGNLTGNVTGNLTGNVTGNTSGTAASIANLGGWSITPSGTTLYFNYDGTNVGSLDSSGNLTTIGNITAYGTV